MEKHGLVEEQVVVFKLNDEMYGVEVHQVQSIIPIQEIAIVPGAPDFIEGVINLRGAVVPVVDLRIRFNLSQPKTVSKSVIVIVEVNELKVGLVVDKVTEVTRIPESAIEPPSPLLTSVDTAYLRGIGKLDGERVIVLLDLQQIFSLREQQHLTETVVVEPVI